MYIQLVLNFSLVIMFSRSVKMTSKYTFLSWDPILMKLADSHLIFTGPYMIVSMGEVVQ